MVFVIYAFITAKRPFYFAEKAFITRKYAIGDGC